MHSNPAYFAHILREAADSIARQPIHPGQTTPGIWEVNSEESWPAATIVNIIWTALARVCRAESADLEKALESYRVLSRDIPLTVKGAPDVIAAQHLRDVATEVDRLLAPQPLKQVV
jgi:hypothetical protein